MIDVVGLVDDQIGGGEGGIDVMQVFFQVVVVMQEMVVLLFDDLVICFD